MLRLEGVLREMQARCAALRPAACCARCGGYRYRTAWVLREVQTTNANCTMGTGCKAKVVGAAPEITRAAELCH
jgi:hypothetical protein